LSRSTPLTVLLFPGSIASLAAGGLFGVALGALLTVLGASIGAVGSFYLGRALGRDEVERIAGPRARRLDSFLRRHGFTTVLYLRLVPVVPFNVFNYACGATGVRGQDYFAGNCTRHHPGLVCVRRRGPLVGQSAVARVPRRDRSDRRAVTD
jgi:uncharacterized membrane protein YdjX (TVP38/TMEM64 family)